MHGRENTDVFLLTNHSPGRFYAVALMKLTLVFILLRYDIKFEGKQPKDVKFLNPDKHAKVMFRRRQN